jgi:putative ATP-dependent endonuclease of the OLD family
MRLCHGTIVLWRKALLDWPTCTPSAAPLAREYLAPDGGASSAAAAALVAGLERACEAREQGVVLLIEEPEVFLRPQAQRYMYRLLRRFAQNGNQVDARAGVLERGAAGRAGAGGAQRAHGHGGDLAAAAGRGRELPRVQRDRRGARRAAAGARGAAGRGSHGEADVPVRVRRAWLRRGREAITIVDCGGKPNVRLFIRICHAARVPCVAVHDRDAPLGRHPSQAQQTVNEEIARLAGPERTVVLAPDFEGVAGLRGHRHKPTHAWQLFSHVQRSRVPRPLTEAVEKVVALARA